jgi:hypothetical protein
MQVNIKYRFKQVNRLMTFTPNAAQQLHQHQAMSLINRWVKLKDYWHHDDRDELYALKSQKLIEWLSSGDIITTGLIKRESSFFANMRQLVKNNGDGLTRLPGQYDDALHDHPDYAHVIVLVNLADGENISVPLPEQERLGNEAKNEVLRTQYATAIANHKLATKAWRGNGCSNYHGKLKTLWHECVDDVIATLKKVGTHQALQAISWCREVPTVKQLHRIRIICGDSVSVAFTSLVSNVAIKPVNPPNPTYYPTETEIEVDVETYVSGTIPVVDEALDYARKAILCEPDESPSSIASRCFEVEHAICDLLLANEIESLIHTCKRILSGKLQTSEAIYDELIEHELDFSETLGLNTYTDSWGNTTHARFGKWHETNLDPKGLWLVEFQSQIDRTCTFHMPYNEAIRHGIKVSTLPVHKSDVSNYGRAVTAEEQALYPIELLLSMFDLSPTDFSYGLRKYEKPTRQIYFDSFNEDEDDDDDILDFYLNKVA